MGVKQQLEAMKAVFTKWKEHGVPKGIKVPTNITDAVGWKCLEFGIQGVGSKRDLNTKSSKHKSLCEEVAVLLGELRSPRAAAVDDQKPEPAKPKRQYVSREVRDRVTKEQMRSLRKQVEMANAKVHVVRDLNDVIEGALKREQFANKSLSDRISTLEAENAELKRIVATQGGALTLIR